MKPPEVLFARTSETDRTYYSCIPLPRYPFARLYYSSNISGLTLRIMHATSHTLKSFRQS